MNAPRAAVDVGSNSVRLLVVDGDGHRLERVMTITRLAAGVDRTGHLDDEALERTLTAIAGFRDRWRALGVTDRVRIAATSAVRDASDRDRFFDGVMARVQVPAEVLTGREEAALAFVGAAGAVTAPSPTLVVDIGGGSTELVLGDRAGGVAASVSLQLGCVRITERHLHSDPATPAELAAAEAMIAERLAEAEDALASAGGIGGAAGMVAVAGTATTLAALHAGLSEYDEDRIHGTRIPTQALGRLAAELAGMTSDQRARLGPVQPGREDVIQGGALILHAVAAAAGVAEVVVSEADNLDGLAASLA